MHFSRTGLVLLALLTLGWGFNWPVMKLVLRDVPPLTFRGACLLAGGRRRDTWRDSRLGKDHRSAALILVAIRLVLLAPKLPPA